jgi:CBS domain-containing protein
MGRRLRHPAVVDDALKLTGVVTDRDLFIALATRREGIRLAGNVLAPESGDCSRLTMPQAMARCGRPRRRLPVIDKGGTLVGICR